MMSVHEDTIKGLSQALEYVKGDKSKARSVIVTIPDEEIERSQLFYQKFERLPETSKQKAIQYIDELLQASSG